MPSNHFTLCHPLLLPPSIFPIIRIFPMSQVFIIGGQRIGVLASASVLPMNIQDWFPLGLTGWIALQSKRLSRVFSNTIVQKHQFLWIVTYNKLWTVWQGCVLSSCFFNLYAEHIMRNARLDKLQAGIKIGRWNINNFRYADNTTLINGWKWRGTKEPLDKGEEGERKICLKTKYLKN